MHSRMLLVPALAIVAITLVGCGTKSTSPAYGGGGGGTPTGPSFNLTFPATGSSQSVTFTDIGSWAYHCTPHQGMGMTGTVVVSASASSDSATVTVGVPTNTFAPATVTIKPGGYVRWVNGSSVTIHTVTRP